GAGGEFVRRVGGDVDHVRADLDQLTPNREVVDGAAVVKGVDDCGRLGGEAGEILRDGQPGNVRVRAEEGLERDRGGELPRAHEAARNVIDLGVDRLEEMRRL